MDKDMFFSHCCMAWKDINEMLWVRAIWKEENRDEEGVLPSLWVKDGFVFWPRVKNANRAMLDGKIPSEKWKKYPLIREKLRSENKQECEGVPYTTCDESESEESEVEQLRKHSQRERKKRNFSEYVIDEPSTTCNVLRPLQSSDEDEEDDYIPGPSPPRKIKPVALTSANTQPRCSSPTGWSTRVFQFDITPPRPSTSRQDNFIRNTGTPSSPTALPQMTPCSSSQQACARSTDREPGTRADVKAMPFPMSEQKFQKKLFYMLVDMRMEIKELKEAIYDQTGTSGSGQKLHLPDPAETMEEVLRLNRTLNTTDKQDDMIQRLCKIGGNSVRDNARKIMEKLIFNDIMSQFNVKGNKGKSAFSKLNLFKVVQGSIMKTMKCTETDAINAIAVTLKYAPDRRGGSGRKKRGD